MWRKRFITAVWSLLGVATLVLLVAAMDKKKHEACADIKIEIEGAEEHVFVDEKDVMAVLKRNGAVKGAEVSVINLRLLEKILEKNAWIKNAELFFDNNQTLNVKIAEREPIARVFSLSGRSFYIDSSGMQLPLSSDLSARVPVFTSFRSDSKKLSAPDSLLLNDIKKIAQFINEDSFWTAQVSQIDITPQRTFEMIPVIGNQVIVLGNADSLQSKFDRLFSFYKQVWAKTGFEKYEKIDVQFKGQVVATRRGATKPVIDSLQSSQQFNNSIEKMNAMIKDTIITKPKAVMGRRR